MEGKWHAALGAIKVEIFEGKPKQNKNIDSFYIYTPYYECYGEMSAQKEPLVAIWLQVKNYYLNPVSYFWPGSTSL